MCRLPQSTTCNLQPTPTFDKYTIFITDQLPQTSVLSPLFPCATKLTTKQPNAAAEVALCFWRIATAQVLWPPRGIAYSSWQSWRQSQSSSSSTTTAFMPICLWVREAMPLVLNLTALILIRRHHVRAHKVIRRVAPGVGSAEATIAAVEETAAATGMLYATAAAATATVAHNDGGRVQLPPYRPFIRRHTIHVKIPFAEPEDIAQDLERRLRSLVEPRGLHLAWTYIRRGCVELTMVLEEMQPPSLMRSSSPRGGVNLSPARARSPTAMPDARMRDVSVHSGRSGAESNEAPNDIEVLKLLKPLALLQALGLTGLPLGHPATTAGVAVAATAARAAGIPTVVAATAGHAVSGLGDDRCSPKRLLPHNDSLNWLMHMEQYDLRTGFAVNTTADSNSSSCGVGNSDGGGTAAARHAGRKLQVSGLQPRVLVLPPPIHAWKGEAAASQPGQRGSWPIQARLSWTWERPPQNAPEEQHQEQQKPQQHQNQPADTQGKQLTALGEQQQLGAVGPCQRGEVEIMMRSSSGEDLPVRMSCCPKHPPNEVPRTDGQSGLQVETEKTYNYDCDAELLSLPTTPGVVLRC
ncbi:hypothetical protein Vafri_6849 [Volvox africanus]|uniref:Uncharacterized protein n=1 Tax=Volvox africanus TaxID=51714 RepID=A0A8J4B3V4_9CHLO|nr:hypothetical protein Vafri_6849 [Volvox africanus]